MNLKKKIIYFIFVILSIVIMMPFAEAKTTAYYKNKNGNCTRYPELPGFCVQPGVTYRSSANYSNCDISLTCYQAAAAWYGKQNENTNSFWAAQTILNGRTFYSSSSCSTSTAISTQSASQYATDYCTLPKFEGTEYNMNVGDTITIVDENSVLSNYTVYTASPSIKATKSGNQIVIEALSAYTGAEILIYKGSKTAVTGLCSSSSQNLVKVTSAPYVYKKIYVNVDKDEEPQPIVKHGALKILKTDEYGQPIENVGFKLGINLNGSETNGDYVVRYTNSEGIITYNNIVVGSSFYYQEISVPEGYNISDSRVKYIYIGDEKTYEVNVTNFTDQTKGAIKVIKTDEYGNPLEGVEFKIGVNLLGRENYDYWVRTTNKYGEIIITDLDEGVYSVKESNGIEGYIFNEEEAYTYTLVINEEQNYDEIVIKNRRDIQRQLTIIKTSKEDEKPLPNVKINIYNEDGSLYEARITDEYGTITIDNIEFGEYYIEEMEAATGYAKLENTIHFEISEEEPVKTITITNELINSKTGEVNLIIGFVATLLITGCIYFVLKKRQKLI